MKDRLLSLVSEDSAAFAAVMAARRLPQGSQERACALREAERKAAEVPAEVVRLCARAGAVAAEVASSGNQACLSDAGVAAAMALAGAEGAALNVLINLPGLSDRELAETLRLETLACLDEVRREVRAVLEAAHRRLECPGPG